MEIEDASVAVLACASALEGSVNRILEHKGFLKDHERSSLRTKIEFLIKASGGTLDWDVTPWADVKNLLDVRNWLAHYKESWAGLMNREGYWVRHCDPNAPRFSPNQNLNKEAINSHYQCVRAVVQELACVTDLLTEFEYINEEDFESMIQTG